MRLAVGIRIVAAPLLAIAVVAAYAPSYAAGSSQVQLRPAVRIQSPGQSAATCPIEGEPSVATTSAGTWVAYNDDQGCPINPTSKLHLTGLQLIPAGGGAPRYVQIKAASGGTISGDPALTPDPQRPGSVLLATLESLPFAQAPSVSLVSGGLALGVYSVSPSLQVTPLPSPTVNPSNASDDKEFIASDQGVRSKWRGRTYLAWDDFAAAKVLTFRAFDGHRWGKPVRLADSPGAPDVAVAPNGDVAVAYETAAGVGARISHDGGVTFTDELTILRGSDPGRDDPACPLRPSVGQRQRVLKSPRTAYDRAGSLHVVAALGTGPSSGLLVSAPTGVATGGVGVVEYATTRDGEHILTSGAVTVPQDGDVQFDPAVSQTPSGGVAVEWLQTTGNPQTTYNSWLAVSGPGAKGFAHPVKLSDQAATFPPLMEAVGNSDCYGIGDYTGLAATRQGVVAVWPTSGSQVTPYFDTDVLAREAVIR